MIADFQMSAWARCWPGVAASDAAIATDPGYPRSMLVRGNAVAGAAMWASMSDRPASDVECCVTFVVASDAVRVLGGGALSHTLSGLAGIGESPLNIKAPTRRKMCYLLHRVNTEHLRVPSNLTAI